MKTLFDRLKKDPYFKLQDIEFTYPYSYRNILADLKNNYSIYNCKFDTINSLNLFVFFEVGQIDIKKITDLFDE
jgi:hypothetical protein